MSAPPNQRDRLTALALFAVALALRVPFRSEYAYHWDSRAVCAGNRAAAGFFTLLFLLNNLDSWEGGWLDQHLVAKILVNDLPLSAPLGLCNWFVCMIEHQEGALR